MPSPTQKIHYLFVLIFSLIISLQLSCDAISIAANNGLDDTDEAPDWTRTDVDGDLKLLLPYLNGLSYVVTQGYNGLVSHDDEWNTYALDFDLAEGDPILAVADGRVIMVKEDSDVGGALDEDYLDDANFILIDHGDGYFAAYYHLCFECVSVSPGDLVEQGDLIGYAGNTGYSDAPHLHFQMNTWAGGASVPYGFYDVPDAGGLALEYEIYSSQNDGSSIVPYVESEIPVDAFHAEHGITLDEGLPWHFAAGDTLTASGSVDNSNPWVALFILDTDGNWISGVSAQTVSGEFSLSLTVPAYLDGNYLLSLATADIDYYYTDWAPYVLIEGE